MTEHGPTPRGRPRKGDTRSVELHCKNCGNPFTRKLSQVRLRGGVACSRTCADMLRKRRNADRRSEKHEISAQEADRG